MFLLTLATEGQERIVYTRDQLIALCKPALLCEPALLTRMRPEVPKELRRSRRGYKMESEEEETQTGCTCDRHGEHEVSGEQDRWARRADKVSEGISWVQCVVFHEDMASLYPGPQRGNSRLQHCSGGRGHDKQQKEERSRDCTVCEWEVV